MPAKTALGLMSGTSADGVSIAAITPRPFRVLACDTYPYPKQFQKEIIGARDMNAGQLSSLSFRLGVIFARATEKFCRRHGIKYSDIASIASHGQTICHYPHDRPAHTLQIGESSFMAELTGAPVVEDFRVMDMAAGGQGAPLVPFLDEYLFGNGPAVLLQNIGGIGNVAVAGKGVRPRGFDTGPGNCLMDDLAQMISSGRLAYDKDGAIARKGRADAALVRKFLQAPFFAQKPPKSLDRVEFGHAFLKKHWPRITAGNAPDIMATLNLFSAASIALAAEKYFRDCRPKELIVSGGGALNPVLMENIARLAAPLKVLRSSERGLAELAKEPACFALMGYLAVKGETNHCPQATGARGRRILGKIIPAQPIRKR